MDNPDQARVLADLQTVSDNVSRTFQKATWQSSNWFKPSARPYEPTMFACMVRYRAQQYFGLDAEDEEALKSETLPNIGLQLYFNGYLCKILKANDGAPPVHNSNARVEFYNQTPQIYYDHKADVLVPTTLNLIYLWECDANHRLSALQLCCPKRGGLSKAEIELHWSANLPIVEIPTAELPKDEDLPYEATRGREDLPIGEPEEQAESE